jgi:DNA polymerase III subunit beta
MYPDVQKIIPKEFKTEFTINREEWMKALERASVMKEKDKSVLVKLSVSNGTVPTLTLETQHPQIEKMTEELFIEANGEACLNVNAKYLYDALKHMEAKGVQVRLNGKMDPFLIVPTVSSPSLALVLPIRVN